MLDPAWVGRRVVIRRAVGAPADPGPGAAAGRPERPVTDSVGQLLAVDGRSARLRTAAGELTIELTAITAARLVVPSSRDILALEVTASNGWRPAEIAEAHGWRLRANGGFSGRANSVLPLHPPDPDLRTALDAARAWYAERGLPLRVATPLPVRTPLDAALAGRGWSLDLETVVLATELNRRSTPTEAVSLADVPDDEWLAGYHHASTAPAPLVRSLMTRHDRVTFAAVRRDGQTIAIGRGAVDDGWLGVTAVAVVPGYRRTGLAQAVMAALTNWAVTEHGARRGYLQVEHDNVGALELYRRLGYWEHHRYRYRTEPTDAGPGGPTMGTTSPA